MAARRSSRSTRGARRKHTSKRAPARAQWRDDVAAQLGGHRTDAAALALGVAALLTGLGIFSDVDGPVGRFLDRGSALLLGRGKFLVPVAFAVLAVATVAQRGRSDDDDESEPARKGVRLALGAVLVCASVVGLMHLGRGSSGGRLEPLRDAGGLVGAIVGAPLRALVGYAGAVVVLLATATLGVLLVVGAGIRQVIHATGSAARFAGRHLQRLLTLPPRPDDLVISSGPPPRLIDQLADDVDVDLVAAESEAGLPDAAVDDEDEYDENEDEEEEEGEYAEGEYAEGEYEDEEYEDEEEYEEDGEEDEHARPAPSIAWKLPATNVLKRSQSREVDPRLVEQGGEILEATMREFGVDARVIGATVGPTVTRYELELAAGVKVNRVTGLAKEIAYAMASHDVRILAPIPGRSAIGVEVPNKMRPLVTLGDVLAGDEAKRAKHPLDVAMGRDIAGRAVLANLASFPHVLIAGQTGAGKSSCINSIVTSMLMRTTPSEVRMILVDPKRVELGQYNGVPHLLTEVVTNPKKAANALDWAVREMEMRYDLLADVGVRDIAGFNAMYDRGEIPTADDPDPDTGKAYERLPFVVVVVDELADLMMVAARDVETSICRLAQMARAVGIHLVIATQRPSVDVITGVIKANIPSRLAFSVSTLADSRVILDQPGAEKLIGKGDMLMLSASSSRTERIQGAWVDEECVRKVVAHWRRQVLQPNYVEGVQGDENAPSRGRVDDDESDDLLDEAMELVVTSGLGSTSMLQRKLRVGFARAGRLMDLLERRGVVGPSEGSKARAVLMTVDELEEMRERR